MKHARLVASLIALLFAFSANAKLPTKFVPSVDLGIKIGTNFDRISGTGWTGTYQSGYHGGMFVGFREQVLGVQGEALVVSGRYATSSGTNVKNLYLDIPGLFQIRLVSGLWFQVGPQYTLLLSSNQAGDNFKAGGFSGVTGLQFMLPLHLTLGGRYIFGISDWNNIGGGSWKQTSVQLSLGLRFF
jgi:hypothetical protein